MAITKEQKKEILKDLVDKFGRSKAIIFSDYRGLDVASVSDLRNRLREEGSEAKVAKKTLIKLAAKENNIEDLGDEIMEGPVSATFSYEDEMSGLKILFKFSKENENLKLLGGIINGKVVSKEEIIALAKLPSKEELYAKFIGSMNAPVSGFVGILSNLLGGFVRVLGAYKDSMPAPAEAPADKPAEAPKEEVKKEEPKAEAPKEEPASEDEAKPADTAEPEGDAVETHGNASPEEKEEGTTDEQPTDDQPAEEEKPAPDESEKPSEEAETPADENSSEEEDDLGDAEGGDKEEGSEDKEEETAA